MNFSALVWYFVVCIAIMQILLGKNESSGALQSDSLCQEEVDVMLDCEWMIHSPSPFVPLTDLRYYTGSSGEMFAEAWSNSSTYLFQHVMRLHVIAQVEESNQWTNLCISIYDVTTYTYVDHPDEGGRPISWITMHALNQRSIGIIDLRTSCWRNTKLIADCDAEYYPTPNLGDIPQFTWSPLEEQFWNNFSLVNFPSTWIWKININVNKTDHDVNIQPHWIQRMNVPCLKELEITGNDWGHPEKLLGTFKFLTALNLSRNKLESIPEGMFKNLPELRNLTLTHNNISVFPSGIKNLEHLIELSLSFSASEVPLTLTREVVESNMSRSLQILKLERTILDANFAIFISLPSLTFLNVSRCFLGNGDENKNATSSFSNLVVLDLSSNSIVNPLELSLVNFTQLDTLILCNNSITFWDESLMNENDLSVFSISKNRISRVSGSSFNNFKRLEILLLSENKIRQIDNYAFQQNLFLRKIDISNNKIEFIPEGVFSKNERLQEVFLSNNKLKEMSYFGNAHLKYLDLSSNRITKFIQNNTCIVSVDLSYNLVLDLFVESIDILNLSHNSLSYISNNMWNVISNLKQIDLGENNFDCCLFLNNSILSINYKTIILNLGTIRPFRCSVNAISRGFLENFVYNYSDCKSDVLASVGIEVIITIVVIACTIIVVTILIYVYRFDISYILHLIKLKKFGSKSDERSCNACFYDAFVCYSAKDFSWVVGRLLPALEQPPYAYRLCVHDRDFTLGAAIHRNIVASLEKSRKVILVLSNDFIASKWCQWELDMANYKMFVERRCSILLVELEQLKRQCLPWHLRYLMARITYLQWPSESDSWEMQLGEEEKSTEGKKQRLQRREEVCLKRIREALGESLAQRKGSFTKPLPSSVLDVSNTDQELIDNTQSS